MENRKIVQAPMEKTIRDRMVYLKKQADYYRYTGDNQTEMEYLAVLSELEYWANVYEPVQNSDK